MARGRIYTVVFSAVTVSVTQDVLEITPADDKPCDLIGIFLSQHSDFGDAQDEVIQLSVIRGFTSSGSGGSAPTPRPIDRNGAAAGFTAEVNNTTPATTGTTHTLHVDGWNVRAGYGLWFPEGCAPNCTQADTTMVVRITAPVDALTANGTFFIEEH